MQEVYRLVRMVAPRDTTVLVTGETGTGKELVAQAIHQLSGRAKHPFVTVNCAAIPEALLESEMFGHVRGAFTGAVQSRLGRIHVAHGGTLFLDEVGELPLGMQAKLLRFLQNGEVQRLGSPDVYKMDVRLICATNARLSEQVQARQFRQDLYYRLAVFPVHLPALRHRLEDLEALTEHFLRQLSAESGMAQRTVASDTVKVLMSRRWEGNVRELQHTLERAFILAGESKELNAEHCREFQESAESEE
jgi:transcriptional regulator with GAF, ATPase, and Fis domain